MCEVKENESDAESAELDKQKITKQNLACTTYAAGMCMYLTFFKYIA